MHMNAPRWKLALDKALAAYPKATGKPSDSDDNLSLNAVVIQMASLDVDTPVPHVRSLVFRAFISPTDDETHPLLLATTDVRSPKTTQLIANPNVQVVWWIEGAQEQYRIAGTARVIPAPSQALHKHFVHTLVELQNQPQNKKRVNAFDWEAQRLATFRSMSPYMKASWCRPVPGSRLEGGQDEAKRWPVEVFEPKEGEDTSSWDMALSNFALLVIEPREVDHIELAPVPNLRTRYWRTQDGVWRDEELVP
ncbi:Pyridox-oxase-2 domain-containing protein [Mycena chlorophos]|uniref:Pyridox-oxase-2 domain-containing protein n=1 Tax=Mycena chlorophos TaxID=658473 RepID=A0A8H6SP86_MYCCL|nr:Pyridox-oxase-2 domain-containing protein [Mycena chlorophos]